MMSEEHVEPKAGIVAQARTAFGSEARAERWLRRPTTALDGKAPLDLLDAEAGADRVRTLFGSIEHGIAA